MRKSILIKAFGMIAVFGAMVLWSCSQDEEIEEQMEWSKKAVKKSLARSGSIKTESYIFRTSFSFYHGYLIEIYPGTYFIDLSIKTDTTDSGIDYTYEAEFNSPPSNAPLTNETVEAIGSVMNGYHVITFTIGAEWDGETKTVDLHTTIPPWVI